jgi:hypothetical protein
MRYIGGAFRLPLWFTELTEKHEETDREIDRQINRRMSRWMDKWTQSICEPELRHSKRGRENGKGKGQREDKLLVRYRFPSLPVPRLAGQQCLFEMVDEARNCVATSLFTCLDM